MRKTIDEDARFISHISTYSSFGNDVVSGVTQDSRTSPAASIKKIQIQDEEISNFISAIE